jgi:SAM-dependent methyltransferase
MPDDPKEIRKHYATDANLVGRQQLFAYAGSSDSPSLESRFTWPSDAVVLDVGCGNGLWTAHAAARTAGGLTLGLDVSAGMVEAARSKVEVASYCQADATDLPIRGGTADVVLAFWMLYHVPDKERALDEFRRVLKPGGQLMAATNANRTVGRLDDVFLEAASLATGRSVDSWFPPLDFALENGVEVLSSHFDSIDSVISTVPFSVPAAEPIVVYASTLRAPVVAHLGGSVDFDVFLSHVSRLAASELSHGPIQFERQSALFIASNSA